MSDDRSARVGGGEASDPGFDSYDSEYSFSGAAFSPDGMAVHVCGWSHLDTCRPMTPGSPSGWRTYPLTGGLCMAPLTDGRSVLVGLHTPPYLLMVPLSGGASPATVDAGAPVTAVAASPDGGELAAATEQGHVLVWDPRDGRVTRRHRVYDSYVDRMMFEQGGTLLAATDTGLWAVRESGPAERVGEGACNHMSLGMDGSALVSLAGSVCRFSHGRQVGVVSGTGWAYVWSAAESPTGVVALGLYGGEVLLRTPDGDQFRAMRFGGYRSSELEFSPNGRHLLVVHDRRELRITNTPEAAVERHPEREALARAVLRDGDWVAGLALADHFEEHGQDREAQAMRGGSLWPAARHWREHT